MLKQPLPLVLLSTISLVAMMSGCSKDESGSADGGAEDASSTAAETSTEGGTGGDGDDGGGDGDGDGGGDGDGDTAYCDDLGLPVATLATEGGNDWGEVATDFTVNTTFGAWSLSESWTGCDTYFFIVDNGDTVSSQLKSTLGPALFERSALNVHYIFITASGDPVAGADSWQQAAAIALNQVEDPAIQDHFVERVHFVTDAPSAIGGGLGDFLANHGGEAAFAIDRAQTWDDPGAYYEVTNSFVVSSPVYGYLSRYYNFRHAQALDLAAQTDVTEVAVIDNQVFAPDCVVGEACFDTQNGPFSNSNNNRVWAAEFPASDVMSNFDTMEMVVTATCGPDNYSDCGHWDYEAFVDLCDNENCDNVIGQVGRWITPYSRPGTRSWVIDASPYLGYVQAGGTHHFRFSMVWNMNPSTWDIRFRLRNTGKETRPAETVLVHHVNRGFNDTYNDGFSQLSFTPPAGTTKVELASIISGHGQATGNCAEWCNHQHVFTVNGTTVHKRQFAGEAGVAFGCAEMVDVGVVPGQWGNWTPGRAGWCPGLPVQPWVLDITDDVQIGVENTLDYEGQYLNNPVTGDRGRIRIDTVLVYHQ